MVSSEFINVLFADILVKKTVASHCDDKLHVCLVFDCLFPVLAMLGGNFSRS